MDSSVNLKVDCVGNIRRVKNVLYRNMCYVIFFGKIYIVSFVYMFLKLNNILIIYIFKIFFGFVCYIKFNIILYMMIFNIIILKYVMWISCGYVFYGMV